MTALPAQAFAVIPGANRQVRRIVLIERDGC